MSQRRSSVPDMEGRMKMPSSFVTHTHEETVHNHPHAHVSHYAHGDKLEPVEHMVWAHEHLHNHAEVEHAHEPHENVEEEHLHEAHVHDHDHPWSP